MSEKIEGGMPPQERKGGEAKEPRLVEVELQAVRIDQDGKETLIGEPYKILVNSEDGVPEVGTYQTTSDGFTYTAKPEELKRSGRSAKRIVSIQEHPDRPVWSDKEEWFVGSSGKKYANQWTRGN